HARLGVGFEQEQAVFAQLVIPTEVGTAGTAATEHAVRLEGIFEAQLGDVLGDLRRADVFRHAVCVLGVEIVEAALGNKLRHQQRSVTQHGGRQLPTADVGLG